jgi:hypothetical protein
MPEPQYVKKLLCVNKKAAARLEQYYVDTGSSKSATVNQALGLFFQVHDKMLDGAVLGYQDKDGTFNQITFL